MIGVEEFWYRFIDPFRISERDPVGPIFFTPFTLKYEVQVHLAFPMILVIHYQILSQDT